MIDRPDAAQLLRAMARTLSEEVLPATSGSAQHSVRVVANLCRILEREADLGESGTSQTRTELRRLLGREDGGEETLAELIAELDRSLAGPIDANFERRAYDVLLADVRRRLAIDRPGYDQ